MIEPQEPEGPLRRLFEELEGEFESGIRKEDEQGVAAALRAQAAETPLWEVLARRAGGSVVALSNGRAARGILVAAYQDFFVLRGEDGGERLVRLGAATTVALRPVGGVPGSAPTGSARRYSFALALRELGRRRELVVVELSDGNVVDGMVGVVGRDYLELDERRTGDRRPPDSSSAAAPPSRLIPFAAVVAVSLPQVR